jgi:hypothetical protein
MVVPSAIYNPGGINTPGGARLSTFLRFLFLFPFLLESSPFLWRLRDPGPGHFRRHPKPQPHQENLGGHGEYQGDSHVGGAVGKTRRFQRHVVRIKCTTL